MTKEEIYLKHVGKGTNVRSVFYQRCLDAMEEYAEQSRQAAVSGSFDDAKFIDALFGEYNKSYKETKPGQVFPRWLDDEQLKWVITVAKNCC